MYCLSVHVSYVGICVGQAVMCPNRTLFLYWSLPLQGTDGLPSKPLLTRARLFHSLLAQPWKQAICLPFVLCKGHWSQKPTMHGSLPWMHWTYRYPQSVFELANHMAITPTKHKTVSYPTDSPTTCRLSMCNSLRYHCCQCVHMSLHAWWCYLAHTSHWKW